MTQVEHDIKIFFEYFRKRHQVAKSLAPAQGAAGARELSPDQHILVAAGIDALANHWGELVTFKGSDQCRMASFLLNFGGHECFKRVAGPYLVRHSRMHAMRKAAVKKQSVKKQSVKKPGGSPPIEDQWRDALSRVVSVSPDDVTFSRWQEECTADELRARLTLVNCVVPPEWFDMHLYGGILYKAYRCAWIHEFDEGGVTDRAISSNQDPHYESRNGIKHLVFSGPFLLETYRRAIEGFEQECIANGTAP